MSSKNDDFNSFQKINISKLFSFKCIRKQRGTCIKRLFWPPYEVKQEISFKKIFGGSQILTILTQLSDEIPLYSLSLHAGKGCSV